MTTTTTACTKCKKTYDIDRFLSKTGRTLKTCLECRNKQRPFNPELLDVCLKVVFNLYFSGEYEFRAECRFNRQAIENLLDIYVKDKDAYRYVPNGFVKSKDKFSGYVKTYAKTLRDLDEVWNYEFKAGTLIIKYVN